MYILPGLEVRPSVQAQAAAACGKCWVSLGCDKWQRGCIVVLLDVVR